MVPDSLFSTPDSASPQRLLFHSLNEGIIVTVPLDRALAWLPLESEDAAVAVPSRGVRRGAEVKWDRAPLGTCDPVGVSVGSGSETQFQTFQG